MKTLFRLLTLFMAVPVVELFFLIQVEKLFDGWTGGNGLLLTMALIIATAVAGSYLAKREGLSAWNRLQGSLSGGGLPTDELLDAVIILVAGAFLITPGVLTDLVGFGGMLPFSRRWIRGIVKRQLKKAMREGRLQASFGSFGGVFGPDGDATAPDYDDPFADAGDLDRDGPSVGGTPSKRGPSPAPRDVADGDVADGDVANGKSASPEATPDTPPRLPNAAGEDDTERPAGQERPTDG